ncbi:MAG: ATP cone domain-containing protein [Clostridia bacterium]|jgi:transcriptional regulator NrdR family protein
MKKVIKRDGRIQPFDIGKIRLTLERVSDEHREPFTSSDMDMIMKDIGREIDKYSGDTIHASEIYDIVLRTLKENGFLRIAQYYEGYQKRFEG